MPRSLDKTFCDRDDPYVKDKCMETRLNCPDHLTKNAVTETILMSEMILLKPGLTERYAIVLVVDTRLTSPRHAIMTTHQRSCLLQNVLKVTLLYFSKIYKLSLGQN